MFLRSPWQFPQGRTLPLALLSLGALTLVQLCVAGWGLYRRSSAAPSGELAGASGGRGFSGFEGDDSIRAGQSANSDWFAAPRLRAPEIRAPWQELLEQSRKLASERQMDSARSALEEAATQLPQQAAALAEMAVQYEKLGGVEQAVKLWEGVYAFGPEAGVFFAAADAKLSLLKDQKAIGLGPSAAPSAHGAAQPAQSPPTPPRPGLLRFGRILSTDIPKSGASRHNFTLSIPVQRAENAHVEARDISIQVQFYDQVQSKHLEVTNASVAWDWGVSPVDWSSRRIQTLRVRYTDTAKSGSKDNRKYYGYVAGLYYQDKLLDTRADPPRLGQQYPLPRMLPKE
ncbi:MAG: hypothetical protein RLZZ399_788 [Verrucomicrobiota bacterium]